MRRGKLIATLVAGAALAGPSPAVGAAAAQRLTEALPPGVAELARRLADRAPGVAEDGDVLETPATDPGAPGPRLEKLVARVEALAAATPAKAGGTAKPMRAAAQALRAALTTYREGSPGLRPEHLPRTVEALVIADLRLAEAQERAPTGAVGDLRTEGAAVAGTLARQVLVRAGRAGVSRDQVGAAQAAFDAAAGQLSSGDPGPAVAGFGEAIDQLAPALVFDVELFEQLLRAPYLGEAAGFTYAISVQGALVAEDGVGLARAAPDSPVVAQGADKQVMVASVSKTLTAILVLRLLEEQGISVHTPVAPWLPSDWELGVGQDHITFAHLMNHASGLKQLANWTGTGGSDYAGLRALMEHDSVLQLNPPFPFQYSNVNFALLRVLVAGLLGVDAPQHAEFEPGPLTAAAFEIHLESVYGGIGVPAHCFATDPAPTLMYQWPLDGVTNGGQAADKVLECGGYGVFASAHQLALVLAHLRHTEALLSAGQRDLMQSGLYGLFLYGSEFGDHYGHGGQWNPGMQSCVMLFPVPVEVAVTVNSIGGGYGRPCDELEDAFESSWTAA